MQMVASIRRLDYTRVVRDREISSDRADPGSPMFDPEKAAIWHARQGRVDEAFWLVFLATHFGKHKKHGWTRVRDVYSGLGEGNWTWSRVSADAKAFGLWLQKNRSKIGGGFGNHRKREAMCADWTKNSAATVESYVNWIGPEKSHPMRVRDIVKVGGNDPHKIFDAFYQSMKVFRFGRLGKFDFLALVGRLDLAPIAPGSAYLKGATGPLSGARLLFGGHSKAAIGATTLEEYLKQLDATLDVGMQVLEDSLCNWQKSPNKFIHFRG